MSYVRHITLFSSIGDRAITTFLVRFVVLPAVSAASDRRSLWRAAAAPFPAVLHNGDYAVARHLCLVTFYTVTTFDVRNISG